MIRWEPFFWLLIFLLASLLLVTSGPLAPRDEAARFA